VDFLLGTIVDEGEERSLEKVDGVRKLGTGVVGVRGRLGREEKGTYLAKSLAEEINPRRGNVSEKVGGWGGKPSRGEAKPWGRGIGADGPSKGVGKG